jgi:hypothetical protein
MEHDEVFICPPPVAHSIPAGAKIHPGFGSVTLYTGDVLIAEDREGEHSIDWYTRQAQVGSRLCIDGPLSNEVYAFTADREWTLIGGGMGFA